MVSDAWDALKKRPRTIADVIDEMLIQELRPENMMRNFLKRGDE